jgi:hypothetical protein
MFARAASCRWHSTVPEFACDDDSHPFPDLSTGNWARSQNGVRVAPGENGLCADSFVLDLVVERLSEIHHKCCGVDQPGCALKPALFTSAVILLSGRRRPLRP